MGIYLGIDIGTQSVKALCLDVANRRVVATATAPLALISREDGTREQLAEWWVTALEICLADIDPAIRRDIAAVGVSGQQHGFVALDREGRVLTPVKLWCDTVTAPQCDAIMAAFGGVDRCLREVGNPILPGYTASKILWLKEHHPDRYRRLHTVMLPHDYINYYLTGERFMERGDASGTGLLDIRSGEWHAGMVAAIDPDRNLRACLPPLVDAGSTLGRLRPAVAETLGLRAGVPVSTGGGDNMMAAIGTGNVAPGRLTVSLGTSGTLFAYADRPVIDDSGALAAFCDSTGGWLPLLCTMNCTVATELTRTMAGIPLAELEARVTAVPPGSRGVLTLPFFQGERTPNLPRGQGCVLGLNHNNYTADHLLRSAMESAIYGLRAGVDLLQRNGCDITAVRLTGGGAGSAAWRQMVADIFNLPVAVQVNDEGAALGAAVQACWTDNPARPLIDLADDLLQLDESSSCQPDATTAAIYSEHYQRYQAHVAAVAPLYS